MWCFRKNKCIWHRTKMRERPQNNSFLNTIYILNTTVKKSFGLKSWANSSLRLLPWLLEGPWHTSNHCLPVTDVYSWTLFFWYRYIPLQGYIGRVYRVRFCQSEGQVSCLGHLLWTHTVNMLPCGTQILFSVLFGAAGCANWKGLGSVYEPNFKLYGQKLWFLLEPLDIFLC